MPPAFASVLSASSPMPASAVYLELFLRLIRARAPRVFPASVLAGGAVVAFEEAAVDSLWVLALLVAPRLLVETVS